mmetsp:Transcript_23442/g.61392  ORF Transcript_23442/g.61392 Transcript_23442/m.61392 type:complete len:213 (+) Transcript_23442:1577-2215(+)
MNVRCSFRVILRVRLAAPRASAMLGPATASSASAFCRLLGDCSALASAFAIERLVGVGPSTASADLRLVPFADGVASALTVVWAVAAAFGDGFFGDPLAGFGGEGLVAAAAAAGALGLAVGGTVTSSAASAGSASAARPSSSSSSSESIFRTSLFFASFFFGDEVSELLAAGFAVVFLALVLALPKKLDASIFLPFGLEDALGRRDVGAAAA